MYGCDHHGHRDPYMYSMHGASGAWPAGRAASRQRLRAIVSHDNVTADNVTAAHPPRYPMGCPGSKPDVDQREAAAVPAPACYPVVVLARGDYDADMRRHLLQHSTPHKVELTIHAAAVFVARARLAQTEVDRRKCGSAVAWPSTYASPTASEANEERLRAQMSREEKIEDGLLLLRQRVENIGVKVVHMKDDGNCQFRSLAQELYGDQELHGLVREKTLAHLAANAENYSFFIGEDAEWQQYLQRMARPRTWGDELTIRAAADCFGVVIHVVTTEHENW